MLASSQYCSRVHISSPNRTTTCLCSTFEDVLFWRISFFFSRTITIVAATLTLLAAIASYTTEFLRTQDKSSLKKKVMLFVNKKTKLAASRIWICRRISCCCSLWYKMQHYIDRDHLKKDVKIFALKLQKVFFSKI